MVETENQDASLVRRILDLPRPAWVICAGMFINKFGNFLTVFLVLYLTAQGYSGFLAGVALGAIGLGSFFGNAIGGTVADRLGRRWAIVVSMFGSGGLILLVPAMPNAPTLIGLCLVIGVFTQLYRPAGGAVLVDTVDPKQRIAAFALLRLAINLGMSVGPMVGGLLSSYSYTYLFVGNAVASFLFGLLVALLLKETRPVPAGDGDDGDADGDGAAEPATDRGYVDVFRDPAMRFYLVAVLGATYVYYQTIATLPMHVRDLEFSNQFYGLLLGINALLIVVIEVPLVRFTENRTMRYTIAFGMALLALGVGSIGLATTEVLLIATVVVWTFAEMIYTPVATALPGMIAPARLRGRYQGAEGVAITLAQSIGPALGGFLYDRSPGAHWALCGVIALAAAVLILFARPRAGTGDPSVRV